MMAEWIFLIAAISYSILTVGLLRHGRRKRSSFAILPVTIISINNTVLFTVAAVNRHLGGGPNNFVTLWSTFTYLFQAWIAISVIYIVIRREYRNE